MENLWGDNSLSTPSNVFLEFVERYGPPAGIYGPERMVREVFEVEPDEWQIKTMRAYAGGERYISVRSCHGVGKTALLAWLTWHMLLTKYPQRTVATAPSRAQLEDALVAEVMIWYAKLPSVLQDMFETKKNRVELKSAPESSYFSARTARIENPEALQGIHSDHVLLIGDEASGIPEEIFEAAVGSMSGHSATTVLTSNPVRTTGLFYETQTRLTSWWRIKVTAADSLRVSKEFIQQVAETYGEDSNAYRVRVLGEFPKGDDDTIIPFEYIESAQKRDITTSSEMTEVWGLDCARFGSDANALVRRNRLAVLPLIETWVGRDLMYTAGRVKHAWDACEPSKRPSAIMIDEIGVGAGVVDRLRELGLPVRGINVSETSSIEEQYRNLRTELWFKGRDWLAAKNRALPEHCDCPSCGRDNSKGATGAGNHAHQLAVELAAQQYAYTSSGKMAALPKEMMKKIIKRSPNVADAFLLTLAEEPTTLMHGSSSTNSGYNVNRSQPLRRQVQIV